MYYSHSIILLQFDADLGGSCSIISIPTSLRGPDSSLVQCWCTAFRNSTPSCEGMDFFLMGWVFPIVSKGIHPSMLVQNGSNGWIQLESVGYWNYALGISEVKNEGHFNADHFGDISAMVTFIHGRVPRCAYTPACWSSTIEIVHSPTWLRTVDWNQ